MEWIRSRDAEKLFRCELQVPQAERAELEPGWSYISDLIGCTVFDGDREIGTIADVQIGAGEAPLLIVKREAKSVRDSLRGSVLEKRGSRRKANCMRLPEGLLRLNAPLTEEEKWEQREASGPEDMSH